MPLTPIDASTGSESCLEIHRNNQSNDIVSVMLGSSLYLLFLEHAKKCLSGDVVMEGVPQGNTKRSHVTI